MSCPYFKPEAHTRDEVIRAMTVKKAELRMEELFYEEGLEKISSLQDVKVLM